MELNIFALAFTSAMLHPWREFFIKQNKNPEGACLAAMMVWTTLAALHALIEGIDLFSIQLIWPITLASGLGFICFFIFALRTYRDGDFSSYYPITRADPLFIAIISFLFLGKLYSFILIFGIILVFIGAFFLQYRSGWGILSQPKTLCLAILAMIVHGMVTLMDARAVQVVEPMVQFFWVSLIAVIPLGVIFALNRPKDGHVFEYLFGGWRQTPGSFLMIGASAYVSYFLMLKAFKMGGEVAALSSIRQASIPISVLIGGFLLKETNVLKRLNWSLVLALGIVLIIVSEYIYTSGA